MAYDDLQGFRDASDIYSSVQRNETQRLQQLAQQQYYQDQTDLKDQQLRAQQYQQDKADYQQFQQSNLLKMALQAQDQQQLEAGGAQGATTMAQAYRSAYLDSIKQGFSGKATDDLLTQSTKLEQNAADAQRNVAQQDKDRIDRAGEILSNVSDPVSWAYAKPELAKMGVQIPPQYQSWSDQTASWVQKASLQSKQVADATKLQSDVQNIAADNKRQAQETQLKLDKEARISKNQTAARELVKTKIEVAAPKDTELAAERGALSSYDQFSEMDDSSKNAMATDSVQMYKRLVANGKSPLEARKAARDLVANNIGDDGKYKSMSTDAPTLSSQDQQAIAWAKANPTDPRSQKILSLHGL